MKKIHHDTILQEIEDSIRIGTIESSHITLNLIQAYSNLQDLGLIFTQEETKKIDEQCLDKESKEEVLNREFFEYSLSYWKNNS